MTWYMIRKNMEEKGDKEIKGDGMIKSPVFASSTAYDCRA